MARKPTMDDLIKVLERSGIDVKAALAAMRDEEERDLPRNPLTGEVQHDMVPFGSELHGSLLGLSLAKKGDVGAREDERGRFWTLSDPIFDPIIVGGGEAGEKVRQHVLRQRLNELCAEMPEPQSKDRNAPGWAPKMWRPGQAFAQETETD